MYAQASVTFVLSDDGWSPATPASTWDDTRGSVWVLDVPDSERHRCRITLDDPVRGRHLFSGYTEAAAHGAARAVGIARYTLTEILEEV